MWTFSGWEATRLPGLQEFQVSQFTGAATYSMPIWTPPGPAGLQPKLTLTYNSQAVDSPRWANRGFLGGMGWSLETRLYRAQPGHGSSSDDTFSFSMAGKQHSADGQRRQLSHHR